MTKDVEKALSDMLDGSKPLKYTRNGVTYLGHICECRYLSLIEEGQAVWQCRGCGKRKHQLRVT